MGIKDLWTILSPICERKPLYELEGKTIAIDLSCWVCEAQNVTEYHIQPRMYLRNLYFRACCLLLIGVNPVFVLEGKAPTLKYSTIAARNAIQFKGARLRKTETVKGGKDRSRFNFTLQQCEKMLKYMGLVCVQGNGEAEATCAYLNEDNLVDGCISQDSDCFAYGAKVVYRNFSISQQGNQSASGGSVDVYDIRKSIEHFNIGRNKMLALALLCGSDYSKGVHGVGKDSAVKFFEKISDADVLNRMRDWSKCPDQFNEMQLKVNDKNTCTSCGHYGKLQSHTKKGCSQCGTTVRCSTAFKEQHAYIKNELAIRAKALADDASFPNEELLNEFLLRKDTMSHIDVNWRRPDMIKFVKFTVEYLSWESIYAFQKLLPILTRWQVLHPDKIDDNTTGILHAKLIKKRRNPKGISSYEIIWSDAKRYFENLIPAEQLNGVDVEKLYSTIEPEELVNRAYPELVAAFEMSKIKVKKPTKRKQTKKDAVEDIAELLKDTSISMEIVEKKARKTKKKDVEKPTKTLDDYLRRALINSGVANSSNGNTVCNSTPKKNGAAIDFDLSDLDWNCDDCSDLSDIVEDIVKRKPPELITNKVREIRRDGLDVRNEMDDGIFIIDNAISRDKLNDRPVVVSSSDEEDDGAKSNFFAKSLKLHDSFELSFNKMTTVCSDNDDDTEEYELNASYLKVDNLLDGGEPFVIRDSPLFKPRKA